MDLREARFKSRVTQWALFKMTGVHSSKISLIENGFVEPKEREKEALSNALGFKANEIDWPKE